MWFTDIEPRQLFWALMIAVPCHVIWLLLSRRIHPLYTLMALFLIISPASTAREAAPIIVVLKWGRVYVIGLMVVVGLFMMVNRRLGFGRGSIWFLGAFSFYALGSFWSTHPVTALAYKASAMALVLAGVTMGLSTRSIDELRRGLRFALIGVFAWTLVVVAGMAAGSGRFDGRLDAYGMNPNGIAMNSAFAMFIALTVAVYDKNWILKAASYASSVCLVLAALMTGSRAGMGSAALGACVILAPLVRRPFVFISFAFVVLMTATFTADYVSNLQAAERLFETQNTRAGVWEGVLEQVAQAPLFGHGWLSIISPTGTRIWQHTHNMYLQVLADVGAVGLGAFLIAIMVVGSRWIAVWWGGAALDRSNRWPIYYGMAILVGCLGLGMFESAPVSNASPAALFFGFSVGLADRVYRLVYMGNTQASEALPVQYGGV